VNQSIRVQKPINKELIKFTLIRFLNKVDIINPFISRTSLSSYEYPVVSIKLKQKNISHLANVVEASKNKGYMNSDFNTYTKVKLFFEDKSYNAKLKLHGNSKPHFINDKKSYRVKLSKNGDFLRNMRRFSLILVRESSIATIFSYKLLEYFTGMKVNSFFVKVNINGIDQGLYLLEEKIQKEMLERNNLSGVDVFKSFDHWDGQFGGHWIPYSFKSAYTKHQNLSKKDVGQLYRYAQLYNDMPYKKLVEYIKFDNFAKYEALRALFNNLHVATGDNQRLLYDTTDGKFFPYFRSEGVLNKLVVDKSNNDNLLTFEQNLYGIDTFTKNDLLTTLIKNNDFRELRNYYLNKLIQDKDKIISIYRDLMEKHINSILVDPTIHSGGRLTKYYEEEKYSNLLHNFKVIESYLKYSKVLVEVNKLNKNKYILNITPDSNVPLQITEIELADIYDNHEIKIKNLNTGREKKVLVKGLVGFINKDSYVMGLNENLSSKLDTFSYEITSLDDNLILNKLKVGFKNNITNKTLDSKKIYFAFVDRSKQVEKQTIKNFIRDNKNIKFLLHNKNITIKSGEYNVNEDLIIPLGYSLTIEKGTKLNIAHNKSIITYGSLFINGSKDNPVIVSNLTKNQPFGVVAGVGNNNSKVYISNLDLSGGRDATINGIYFSGGLSLYSYPKTIIKHSVIHHNSADDGLNIKKSEVLLEGNVFTANLADQVDLDFCKGYILNNKFVAKSLINNHEKIKIPYDENGDGLDFSGSSVIVKNNYYDGFLDKGISVGENTKALIADNEFKNNNSAITAKDQSNVYLSSNNYINNETNIEMYKKKKIFDHPSVFNLNEQHQKEKIKKTKGSHYYKTSIPIEIKDISLNIFSNLKKSSWIEYE